MNSVNTTLKYDYIFGSIASKPLQFFLACLFDVTNLQYSLSLLDACFQMP